MLLAHLVDDFAQRARLDTLDLAGDNLHAMRDDNGLARPGAADLARGEFLFHCAQLFFQLLFARDQLFEAVERLRIARAEVVPDVLKNLLSLADRFQSALAGQRLDAPHARGNSRFGLQLEHADLASRIDMSTAA